MEEDSEVVASSSHTENKSNYKKKSERIGVENAWSVEIPKFQKGDMKHSLVEMTDFQVNYPEYREAYIKESFPIIKKIMKEQGIEVSMDAMRGSLTVRTTKNTWDPYAIILARDFIKLIARHASVEIALRVFNEGISSEIVNIRSMCRDKDTFVKRRARLIGANKDGKAVTIDSLKMVTKCDIIIQGSTAAIVGPYKGVLEAMRIVKDSMNNELPYHRISNLIKKNALKNNPEIQDADWSALLPHFKPKAPVVKKKPKKRRQVKEYNPFPPAPLESKVDKQLNDGEFFMDKVFKKGAFNKEEQKKTSKSKQAAKRAAQYIAPEEPVKKKAKTDKTDKTDEASTQVAIDSLKKKLKRQKAKM